MTWCPITFFKLYLSKRPIHLRSSGPLYLGVIYNLALNYGSTHQEWDNVPSIPLWKISILDTSLSNSNKEKLKIIQLEKLESKSCSKVNNNWHFNLYWQKSTAIYYFGQSCYETACFLLVIRRLNVLLSNFFDNKKKANQNQSFNFSNSTVNL